MVRVGRLRPVRGLCCCLLKLLMEMRLVCLPSSVAGGPVHSTEVGAGGRKDRRAWWVSGVTGVAVAVLPSGPLGHVSDCRHVRLPAVLIAEVALRVVNCPQMELIEVSLLPTGLSWRRILRSGGRIMGGNYGKTIQNNERVCVRGGRGVCVGGGVSSIGSPNLPWFYDTLLSGTFSNAIKEDTWLSPPNFGQHLAVRASARLCDDCRLD